MKNFKIRYTLGFVLFALLAVHNYAKAQGDDYDPNSNSIPEYFLGKFTDFIPNLIGGTKPNMKISMECSLDQGCVLDMGNNNIPYQVKKGIAPVSAITVRQAESGLLYARSHMNDPPGPTTEWHIKNLMPLLKSDARIESCINLPNKHYPVGSEGEQLICKLDKNPWKEPVELVMQWRLYEDMRPGPLFNEYMIIPLFRKPH